MAGSKVLLIIIYANAKKYYSQISKYNTLHSSNTITTKRKYYVKLDQKQNQQDEKTSTKLTFKRNFT